MGATLYQWQKYTILQQTVGRQERPCQVVDQDMQQLSAINTSASFHVRVLPTRWTLHPAKTFYALLPVAQPTHPPSSDYAANKTSYAAHLPPLPDLIVTQAVDFRYRHIIKLRKLCYLQKLRVHYKCFFSYIIDVTFSFKFQ